VSRRVMIHVVSSLHVCGINEWLGVVLGGLSAHVSLQYYNVVPVIL